MDIGNRGRGKEGEGNLQRESHSGGGEKTRKRPLGEDQELRSRTKVVTEGQKLIFD